MSHSDLHSRADTRDPQLCAVPLSAQSVEFPIPNRGQCSRAVTPDQLCCAAPLLAQFVGFPQPHSDQCSKAVSQDFDAPLPSCFQLYWEHICDLHPLCCICRACNAPSDQGSKAVTLELFPSRIECTTVLCAPEPSPTTLCSMLHHSKLDLSSFHSPP